MSEQEVEAELDSATDDVETIETGEDDRTPDKPSDKKKTNKSNWDRMSEAKKALERELEQAHEELTAWRTENPDIITSTLSKKSDGIDK